MSLVVGLAAGHETPTILWRGIQVMLICWFVGFIVGVVAVRTVDDHIAQYKQDHPIPSEEEDQIASDYADETDTDGSNDRDAEQPEAAESDPVHQAA